METYIPTQGLQPQMLRYDDIFMTSDPEFFYKLGSEYVLRFIACEKGSVTVSYKGITTEIHADEISFLPPLNAEEIKIEKSTDFKGGGAACTQGLIQQTFTYSTTMRNIASYLREHPVLQWDMDQTLSKPISTLLRYTINESEALFQKEMLYSIFQFILYTLVSRIANMAPGVEDRILNRSELLFVKFMSLLNAHYKQEREVAYYADKLHITPKYLSAICKEQSGRSASVWINEATVGEIRYLLLHSELTIKEISVVMNFPNISFFGRYVKKNLGHSPQAFRKLLKTENSNPA